MRLISVEKDRKNVLMQNVVTLNTCCGIVCLTFQLPYITTGSFQSLQCLEKTQQTFSQMKKFCNLQLSVVTFSGGVGKWITVCCLLR